MPRPVIALSCLVICAAIVTPATGAEPPASGAVIDRLVREGKAPPTNVSNKHYVSNRAPLAASPFVKLPIGNITPRGWLRAMLELEASGMHGHLAEISQWCKFEGNAWGSGTGEGHSPWEELPYWLKGYGDLGYVLKDEKIKAETKKWVEGILASQRDDGWFAPRELLTREKGKPDVWPPMLALNVMQSWHEATGDQRVIPFLTKYFKWQMTVPEQDFVLGDWAPLRTGDNLESVYWLYNRTGDKFLLDLASKIYRRSANWTAGIPTTHGVNFTQGFREPAEYGMQAKGERFLATYRNYGQIMMRFGQMPGGMFVADENYRPGFVDPRGGAEACSMVEFMHSFEMLTRITGDSVWSDRCENVALNSLPAAMTPDLKALHYITCPNQVRLDPGDKTPAIQNGGTMFSYSPGAVYRCCQHNVAHGWPYYAEEMWLATSDNGLCPSLYGASEVTAKVGEAGAEVKVTEETQYPFGDTIRFMVSTQQPVKFPLYLRVPQWCTRAEVRIGANVVTTLTDQGAYKVLEREWKDGDVVTLRLPMSIMIRHWPQNCNSVSVERGPITYSLAIGEKWERYGGSEQWPEWQVTPTTAWNYGLVLDEASLLKLFEVVAKQWGEADKPVNPLNRYDVELRAKARKIPNWTADAKGAVNPLQPSPVKSDEPVETVTLVPMGAARLRISSFPVIGSGAGAREWEKVKDPAKPPVSASHVFGGDSVEALIDGKEPRSSNDTSIPRFTWWDHKGGTEWVQHEFKQPRKVTTTRVYWFDDGASGGGCRLPASWKLLYRDNPRGDWQPVKAKGPYKVSLNEFNAIEFEPVEAASLRLQVQLQKDYSGGILEWRVE